MLILNIINILGEECAEMITKQLGACPICREPITSFDHLHGL